MGQVEMLDIVLAVVVNVGSNAAYDAIKARVIAELEKRRLRHKSRNPDQLSHSTEGQSLPESEQDEK